MKTYEAIIQGPLDDARRDNELAKQGGKNVDFLKFFDTVKPSACKSQQPKRRITPTPLANSSGN